MGHGGRLAARLLLPRGLRDPVTLRAAVSGRTVLITGASYGVGAATAELFGAAGARILLLARTADRLDEVGAAVEAAGGTAYPYRVDLSNLDAVGETSARIRAEHRVDVVVSNAGKSIHRSVHDSYDRFHDVTRTIEVNYLGPVRLLLDLIPGMRERGGHLVNVSSAGVRLPPAPGWAAYEASKAAFDKWFRSIAHELPADHITATTVYLPLVNNRMSAPTAATRRMPGLSNAQAAGLLARAVVTRPRTISPWWLPAGETVSSAARGPIERAMTRMMAAPPGRH
ncbi:MAG: SDR family NAD(P)-dependent oxidoreductase [Mycobacteriales bacterium]